MINHNRIYPWVLATQAVICALSSGLLFFLARATAEGSLGIKLPAEWSLPWAAAVNFVYAIAITIALCVRRFKPALGPRLTRLLNWALIPGFPGGTIVGIYGLWIQRASDHAV
jgi:hypothetical protein